MRAAPRDFETLEVQVVALDWKWLFIYPQHGIAVVNELAAPVDVPVRFSITSSSVMNSFFVPALAGQIYAMPAMETRLHAVINRPARRGFLCELHRRGFPHAGQVFRMRAYLKPGAEGQGERSGLSETSNASRAAGESGPGAGTALHPLSRRRQ